VIVKPPDRTVAQVMHKCSRRAAVVFLGLNDTEPGTEEDYARRLTELVKGFRTTILVRNAGEFAGYLIH
ncbi:MAG: hypothetical protein MUP70_12845, partial [Candidatus Aminicenantes bacterium]|nr:hypothetical protein [Candidatus Aminicenantes bacterium]